MKRTRKKVGGLEPSVPKESSKGFTDSPQSAWTFSELLPRTPRNLGSKPTVWGPGRVELEVSAQPNSAKSLGHRTFPEPPTPSNNRGTLRPCSVHARTSDLLSPLTLPNP